MVMVWDVMSAGVSGVREPQRQRGLEEIECVGGVRGEGRGHVSAAAKALALGSGNGNGPT
jgi:hypothetical protein